MSSTTDSPVVAIFNSNDLALFRLRRAFEAAGYRVVTADDGRARPTATRAAMP